MSTSSQKGIETSTGPYSASVVVSIDANSTLRIENEATNELNWELDARIANDSLEIVRAFNDGDARMAITTLRAAARKASSEGLSNISRRLVEDSISKAEKKIARKKYSKLNDHQRVVYDVLLEKGPLIQRELHERHSERHDNPVSLRYFRETHLAKLEHYELIDTEAPVERNCTGLPIHTPNNVCRRPNLTTCLRINTINA